MKYEKRYQHHLRALLDSYLQNGWEVEARDPIIISRGRNAKYLDFGCLKDGRPA